MGTGIEEVAIPAIAESAAKGAEAAGGADLLAPALAGGAEAGSGLSAAETALALGGGGAEGLAPTALTVNALPGAAAGAGGFDIGGLLGGVGSAIGSGASAIGNAIIPGASAAPAGPSAGPGVSSNAGSTDPITQASLGGGFPTAGQGGQGASAFAPAPGVQLPGGVAPDATSAAAFSDPTFADRILPASQASQSGVFAGFETPESPVGAGAGAANVSSFPAAGTPTASPNLGDFATAPGGTASAGGAPGAGGFDVSGNAIDPITGSSNPQYTGGGTTTQYDPTGAGAANNTGAPAAGDTNILGKVGQGALDSVTKNPLGLGLGALGLGMSLKNANALSQATKNVQAQAGKQSQTADQLANYALTGTVPPGSQAGIDKAIAEAKANAVSNAAGQGLPTDPTKNTALAATLAKIDSQGPILAAQIGQQLLQSGASYAGLSDQLYTQLAQIDQSQRASMGKAIANFAAALNTGGGTRIQIGGTSP